MEHQNTSSVGSVSLLNGQHLARHIVSLPLDTVERAGREPSIETQTVQLTRYVHSAGERRTLSDKVCFKMGQHIMAVATPPTKAEVDEWGTQASGLPQLPKVENESVTARKKSVCCLSCKLLESGGEVPSSSGDDDDDDDESPDGRMKKILMQNVSWSAA